MDLHEKRLQDIVEADRSEYERLVGDNGELFAELGDLRAPHNITAYRVKDVTYWLDNESPDKQAQFHWGVFAQLSGFKHVSRKRNLWQTEDPHGIVHSVNRPDD